ncbi:MAG: GAF domain-containing protein [Thermodesulfovibrionales bacterium]|nr:GAF domain-containing protein [Thermodesulfovibrionales bacterium]
MTDKTEDKKSVVEAVRHQIKILNGIVLLVVYALLFLIIRFMYMFLDYISPPSLVAILSIIAGLVVMGMYVANSASKKAIRTIDDYTNKLNTLLTTTRDMREIEYGDILLENIMQSALKITGADAGSIMLVEGDRLVFKIAKGSRSANLPGLSIPKSEGIVGWAAENGSNVRINDAKNDSRFNPEIDKMTGYETKSLLCVPLKVKAGTIGILELINKEDGAFTHEDEELLSYFADQAAISIARTQFMEDQRNYEINLTDILVDTMDTHIHEKVGHSKRVAKYSLVMADELNMSENEKRKLYKACLLHDIGFLKIKLKDVTSKEQYKAHPQLGYEMLRLINFYADIAPFVLHHHERYEGNGYPNELIGDAIPVESRIIAIAEAFDAMTSRDSYKYVGKMLDKAEHSPAAVFHYAIEELKKNAGTKFDPNLVDIFVNNIDESLLEEA